MRTSRRIRRAVAVSVTVIGMLTSIGAGAAMAEEEPAFFSPSNAGMKWSGSITIYKNGGSAKTCTFPANATSPVLYGTAFSLAYLEYNGLFLSCTGGTQLSWTPQGSAQFDGSYELAFEDRMTEQLGLHTSPYGQWYGTWTTVPYTNGSGGTASTIAFNKTPIGALQTGETVTATGTVKVTTWAGGLLTLSH